MFKKKEDENDPAKELEIARNKGVRRKTCRTVPQKVRINPFMKEDVKLYLMLLAGQENLPLTTWRSLVTFTRAVLMEWWR